MESIGHTLHGARTSKGVTLSQAAAATRIKIQHIESMERDDFSRIAADTYARGFIKIYAEYLGLAPEPLLRLYQQTHAVPTTPSLMEEPASESTGPKDESGESRDWLDLQGQTSWLGRAALAAAAVLVLLLLAGGLASLGSRSRAPAPPGAGARIAEPPDAYLDLDRLPGRLP